MIACESSIRARNKRKRGVEWKSFPFIHAYQQRQTGGSCSPYYYRSIYAAVVAKTCFCGGDGKSSIQLFGRFFNKKIPLFHTMFGNYDVCASECVCSRVCGGCYPVAYYMHHIRSISKAQRKNSTVATKATHTPKKHFFLRPLQCAKLWQLR